MKFNPADAPYKVSRGALREAYGARSIDASSRQSPLDSTPSGRLNYAKQQGMTPEMFREGDKQNWNAQFQGQVVNLGAGPGGPQPAAQPNVMSRIRGGAPAAPAPSFATPQDILGARQSGAVNGQFTTPYGDVSFGSLAPTGPTNASAMSEFLPVDTGTYDPLFGTRRAPYMSSILSNASKWSIPINA